MTGVLSLSAPMPVRLFVREWPWSIVIWVGFFFFFFFFERGMDGGLGGEGRNRQTSNITTEFPRTTTVPMRTFSPPSFSSTASSRTIFKNT
jgi:hypothetical protein